jgi:hypothetical protein
LIFSITVADGFAGLSFQQTRPQGRGRRRQPRTALQVVSMVPFFPYFNGIVSWDYRRFQ